MKVAVTGAFSYSGSYIARAMLSKGWKVNTLTRRPERDHPLQESIASFPLDFSAPNEIQKNLTNTQVLVNTYWVRFNHKESSFSEAIRNTQLLVNAAEAAGVKRIVHLSVSNPDHQTDLAYYRGKAQVEDIIKESKLSYAILRPTLIFGKEELLVNNIAWLLRNLPLFAIPGNGSYRLQPIFVEDLAEMAAHQATQIENAILDAAGPDVLTFKELLEFLTKQFEKSTILINLPPRLTLLFAKVLGIFLRDNLLTWEELKGLMEERLYVGEDGLSKTSFKRWAKSNISVIGRTYANELNRHHSQKV